ncbi:MAG: tRNA lysidine(34) synthetase TilS [Chloroflexi bacterium]|nr:tRNA lysidine(34) synthetase TilS [Chloroflexota bacterium]MYK62245.1 tRNA lysidine(34) synthetase TilS [Chloroflexota bacterium]
MRPKSDDRTFLLNLDEELSTAGVSPEHSIVCAVSGGFDSTALLLGCKRLQHRYRNLTAAHYNHQTRGEESDADEEFVRNLCADTDIALHVARSNHPIENLDENSAREERYAFLAKTSDEVGAEAILVAHTVEDQAETILLRIARGAGLRGAGGMRVVRRIRTPTNREVNIVRPMLSTTHQEAVTFLNALKITARHDGSNDDWERYARNRIRHRIIPELQALNPDAINAIDRFASIMKSHSDLVNVLVRDAMSESATEPTNVYLRSHFAQLHPIVAAATLSKMHRAVANTNTQLDEAHLTKLIDMIASGKSSNYDLPGGVSFKSDHMHIRMENANSVPSDVIPYPQPLGRTTELAVPGELDLGSGFTVTASLRPRGAGIPTASPDEAWLNPKIVVNKRLEIRNRRPSDRFNPLGMNQDVDLSDFLIKAKVAASWRDRIPLVTLTENGRIAWLPGIRPAEWAKLLPTHQIALHLKIERDPQIN